MNKVQHNRQVAFPKELHSLSEFVTDVNDKYIELSVPIEITEGLNWREMWEHPTFKKFFDAAEVEDPTQFINLEIGSILLYKQKFRLYYNSIVRKKLFPWKVYENNF